MWAASGRGVVIVVGRSTQSLAVMRNDGANQPGPSLDPQLVRVMLGAAVVFFAALALYLNVTRDGAVAKFIAVPTGALALGAFAAAVTKQYRTTSGRGRVIVAIAAVLFTAAWLLAAIGK